MNGDKLLSVNEKMVWSLFFYVQRTFTAPIIFTVDKMDIRSGRPGLITFFVQGNSDNHESRLCFEFLEEELNARFKVEPSECFDAAIPGVGVSVYYVSELPEYTPSFN